MARIQSDYERSHATLRRQIEDETRSEFEKFKVRTEHRIEKMAQTSNEEKAKLVKSIEQELAVKDEYFLEL